jgi:tetratricopeptide (TPR) repeat protein
MVAYDAQQLDEALGYHQQALERIQRSLGPDSPRSATPRIHLGLVSKRMGRHDEARRHLRRALQLLEKENGPDSATVGNALRPLARLELDTGAPQVALAHCQRALRLDEKTQGAETPDAALDMACLAQAHLALGAPEHALPLLERAYAVHARAPRDPLDQAWASFLLARALAEQRSHPDRARAALLAREARGLMEGLGSRARLELREVRAWQSRNPTPPPTRVSSEVTR